MSPSLCRFKRPWLLLTLLWMLPGSGCATWSVPFKDSFRWPGSKTVEERNGRASSMVAIWSDDILHQPGSPPTRGVGGRIYFYNDQHQAVQVEGQLAVFAYDESRNDRQGSAPDRKFVFTPEQFKGHYSASKLGASYSIWIPWDEAGGEQRQISLLPIFTSKSGQVVMGQQATAVLPGTKPLANSPTAAAPPSAAKARQASFQQSAAAEPPSGTSNSKDATPQSLRTTTIPLPKTLSQRMVQVGPQSSSVPDTAPNAASRDVTGAAIPAPRYPTDNRALATGQVMSGVMPGTGELQSVPPTGNRAKAAAQEGVPSSPAGSQPLFRSAPRKSRAPRGPIEPLSRDGDQSRPFPGGPPYSPPSQP